MIHYTESVGKVNAFKAQEWIFRTFLCFRLLQFGALVVYYWWVKVYGIELGHNGYAACF